MPDPILILGMHRSGTSCLAGCLEAAGLTLGDVNRSAPHNAKGNREHERIRDIHDRLMTYHGYSWDHPPDRQLSWRPLDLDRVEAEISCLEGAPVWGFKDPRLIFCITGWIKLYAPRFVATFRHPDAVADSLIRRAEKWGSPMPRSHALDLWIRYNRELLHITTARNTPFILFDVEQEVYLARLREIADGLGLRGDLAGSFFSSNLQHETQTSQAVPDVCAPIWNELLERL